MIGKAIETLTFLLTFDIDLTDISTNCITSTKEFVKRFLTDITFHPDEHEFDIIMQDIVLASLLTVISFIERKRIKDQTACYDKDYYSEFKSFYKRTATAETKIKFSSENQNVILNIISSLGRKVDKMIEVSLSGTTKKLLEVSYVNSEIDIEVYKSHLFLVLKIQTE